MVEKINWDDSNFTKMVNTYGDKIAKISENECNVLIEQLFSSEEVNMFNKDIDKKKLKSKNINTSSAALGASVYDAPKVLLGDVEDNNSDDAEENNSNNEKDSEYLEDSFKNTNLKYNLPYENIRPYEQKIKAIAKQVGKNFQDIAIDFITKGPGLTDLNLFENIAGVIKEPVDNDFANLINSFYNKNSVFSKAYDGLLYALGNEPDNINETLKKIVNNILESQGYEEKANAKYVAIFRLILQLLTVVLHNNYNSIKKEFTKTTKNSKIADALYSFYNDMITLKQGKGTLGQKPSIPELIDIINGPYAKCLDTPGIGNNNPIGVLFYIISSAKASGYIENKFLADNASVNKKNKFPLSYNKVYDLFKNNITKIDDTYITLAYDELSSMHQSYIKNKVKDKNDEALKQIKIKLRIKFNEQELNIIHSNDERDKFNFFITSSEWDNAVSKEKVNNPTAYAAIVKSIEDKNFKEFISTLIQYKPFIHKIKRFEVKN